MFCQPNVSYVIKKMDLQSCVPSPSPIAAHINGAEARTADGTDVFRLPFEAEMRYLTLGIEVRETNNGGSRAMVFSCVVYPQI